MNATELMTAILSVCGGVITIDKAIDIALKFRNRAKEPGENIDMRFSKIEDDIEELRNSLEKDSKRISHSEESVSVLQRAMLALIDNAIDGSNKEPLYKAKDELNGFLTKNR